MWLRATNGSMCPVSGKLCNDYVRGTGGHPEDTEAHRMKENASRNLVQVLRLGKQGWKTRRQFRTTVVVVEYLIQPG